MDERRSVNRVAGPEDEHAAMIMANTVPEWSQSYELKFRRRESQIGVDAMPAWRAAMLARTSRP